MQILYVGAGEEAEAERTGLVADVDRVEFCGDQDACVARIAELSRDGAPPHLVVIGSAVSRPLSAARAARAAHGQVGLAVVVPAPEVASMRQRIALSPRISDAAVVTTTDDDLGRQIRRAADAAHRRRRLQGALEEMNVELQRREVDRRTRPTQRSVSDRHLSALTRHAPDAIISVDTNGCIASWNEAATAIFGHDAQETEGTALAELLSPDEERALDEMIQQALDGSPHASRDVDLLRQDARLVTAAVTAAPVRGSGEQVVGAVVIARDVTEQRRTEEQLRHLQKAQSLATLAGGVAHDFNNLLVSVRGWAELALEEPDDPAFVRQALEQIEKSAGQAGKLARQMLAYSGRADLTLETLDVNDVVEDMASLLRSSISRKIDLETELDPSLPPVKADPTQLRQILMNLVTNAAEALGDDSGRIEIRTFTEHTDHVDLDRERVPQRPRERNGHHVVLSVADTGPGMDEQAIRRIFDPFFTTKFTGRGLGLAATLGIVKAHGGTIEVDTEPGAGARFRVFLPAEAPERSGTSGTSGTPGTSEKSEHARGSA